MGCRGLLISRGLGTLFVPRFPSTVGIFLLLVLDVCLGLEEEGVKRGRCLNAHNFGKVAVGTEPMLEEIFFQGIGRRDLHGFFVEALYVSSKRLVSSLYDRF